MVTEREPDANGKLWAGVLLTCVAVVAYIYLKQNNISEIGLLALLTPLVTYLVVGSKIEHESNKQNKTLATIQHQTNGVLEGKIRRIVREELKGAREGSDLA